MRLSASFSLLLILCCAACNNSTRPAQETSASKERLFRAYPATHESTACTPFLEKIQPSLLILKGNNLENFQKPKKCPRFVLLYFSASWCPPCHLFTPELKSWYSTAHPKYPELEVVLASMDRDWVAMEEYVRQTKMPWPVLAWPNVIDSPVEKLLPEEIPYLVLVDDEGMVLMAARGMVKTLGLVEKIMQKDDGK